MNNKGRQVREKILAYVVSYIQDHGYPPTRREIGEAVGLKFPSSVQSHIRRMIGEGTLETDDEDSPRAIRVPGWRFVKEEP